LQSAPSDPIINTWFRINMLREVSKRMGFPVIPFVVGAAVGSVSTYLARDKSARDSVLSGVQGLVNTFTSAFRRSTPAERAAEAGEQAVEAGAETVERSGEAVSETAQAVSEAVAEVVRKHQDNEQPTH
jgi:gas vesicle protein